MQRSEHPAIRLRNFLKSPGRCPLSGELCNIGALGLMHALVRRLATKTAENRRKSVRV